MHDTHDEQEAQRANGQHHVIQREVGIERQQAKEATARHALQAVLATGERRLQAEEVQHLRQRQRNHREVDALPPDRQHPHDEAKQRPGRHARNDADFRREPQIAHHITGDVACAAKERGMAERQQTRKAEQQVERTSEQREAQHLHDEYRIRTGERRDDQRQ